MYRERENCCCSSEIMFVNKNFEILLAPFSFLISHILLQDTLFQYYI